MKKQTLPYPPGFVEPNTGRVAVLVREYAASDLNGDAPAYWYSAQSEEWGLDPWRLVEGVDPHTAGGQFDVCFANGSSRTLHRQVKTPPCLSKSSDNHVHKHYHKYRPSCTLRFSHIHRANLQILVLQSRNALSTPCRIPVPVV